MLVPVSALVYAMVLWINGTGIVDPVLPSNPIVINQTSYENMAHDINRCMVLGGDAPMPHDAALALAEGVYGFYCHDRITLHEDVDLSSPKGQTVLVHELVHWLQDYNGEADAVACMQERERNAYAVHHQWQAEMGLTLQPDPFTVMMRSTCPPGGAHETDR